MSQATRQPLNRLLAALPESEYQRLVPDLEFVQLPLKQVLYEAGELVEYVYFPQQGIVSLVSTMEDGGVVEVGLVGSDGIVGPPVVLGDNITTTTAIVQIPGTAMRMKASTFRAEFQRGGSLQNLVLRHVQALYALVTQGAACNRLHLLEERFARWMLFVSDRLESKDFPLTQEFIAQMLGVRRSGVTVAANTLQQAGMLRYSRGNITIVNHEELEATACECYQVVKGEFNRLLGVERR